MSLALLVGLLNHTAEGLPTAAATPGKRRRRKKVLILMSDTGGGHKASAEAIAAALRRRYQKRLDVDIVDIWTDHSTWPWNTVVPWYQWLGRNPLAWKFMYEGSNFPPSQWFTRRVVALQCFQRFKHFLQEQDPDMIISVHPCCQHLPLRVVNHLRGGEQNRRASVPYVTVVTDLGACSSLWLHEKVDALYVPSDAIEGRATRAGVPKEKLRKYGLPIRPGFKATDAKRKDGLRKKLGMRAGVRTALVVGGGDGVGRLEQITKELAGELHAGGGGQVVVVCGKNEAVKARLESHEWPKDVYVNVKGFVSNMDKLMGASDCIVTKAGPGTIAEACASGLPIMLSGYLPGQEAGNVPLVAEGGFGAYHGQPKQIAKTVSGWLKDPSLLANMSRNARSFGRPEATKEIVEDLGRLLFNEG